MNLHLTEYWEKTRKGDVKSFERLYKDLFHGLYCFALKITGDTFKSEEIVQDLFVKIWSERKKLVIKGSVKRYFYTAIHHSSINSVIEKKTLKNSVNCYSPDSLWLKIQNTFQADDSLVQAIEAKETEEKILKQINKLPPQCREIFILSRIENKSVKEISEILNITGNTVRTQLYRALEKIMIGLQ